MIYHNGISAEGDLTNGEKNDWSRDIDWLSWTGGNIIFEY